ncbi:nicotinate-nucleotide--dimethylbenzimidazole phosphoribosyltransferase [Photobacterium sp. 1_MG-2023]|uniref:nicotinate-nucleotide--dimethylbenzimidazole phosphoribosyltransferase n=1 Tax=Photobacterium sp. 1_MG-2023 TaxID=3062646 RepID=UPI0026E460AD|nr:nicotinate-nucleotide--dimethylbenzimidazole phosphoribosyltransferase [Photobacterium sp. 1_MG-2023]MDO6708161.1 nicotinate-nucleotide--dimethylbenzimidazole phosphoribosyltransferase [Photobacterium sp. 1_MG-2023]
MTLDTRHSEAIQERIDTKTKPPGSLGQLETTALQLALIQSQGQPEAVQQITLSNPTLLLFAGDHGIAKEGVSIAPSEVTQQMVLNFLAGGAAINQFCRINAIALKVIDCGILLPVDTDHPDFILQRLGARTQNLAEKPALTKAQVAQGLELGGAIAQRTIESGCNLLMFGEMGIGNTSSASALLAAITQTDVAYCVGKGTGINDTQMSQKISLIRKGVARYHETGQPDPYRALEELGGFEIVQMVGAFFQASEQRVPVLVDGFIVSVAAFIATRIKPEARDIMIFAHRSEEQGHQKVLAEMEAQPLLDLGLRLGEGTGAALAYPLLAASAEFYNHMASFADAGVTV